MLLNKQQAESIMKCADEIATPYLDVNTGKYHNCIALKELNIIINYDPALGLEANHAAD